MESGIISAVVGWLCRHAALLAGRTLSDALSVPEEAQDAVDGAVDAVLERLSGDSAWQQLQREAGDPEREELPERTRQRLELAVADVVESDARLAEVIGAAFERVREVRASGGSAASGGGVATGGSNAVTASGAGAIAVGGSASGPVTSNAPASGGPRAAPRSGPEGAAGRPTPPGPQAS